LVDRHPAFRWDLGDQQILAKEGFVRMRKFALAIAALAALFVFPISAFSQPYTSLRFV
jgi:hypothetical protein